MAPYALAWASQEPIVASGGYDKSVCVWNIEHNLAKERKLLGSYSDAGWRDLRKAKRVGEFMKLQGHTGNVEAVIFNPQSSNDLCSVSVDKNIIIWDLRSGKIEDKITEIHENDINCVDWNSLDSNYLCTGSSDETVSIIDLRKNLSVHKFSNKKGSVNAVQFCPFKSNMVGAANSVLAIYEYVFL